MHMKGTYHNARLLADFGVRPVILVRRIFDVVWSLLWDLREKERLPGFGSGRNGYSFVWQDSTIECLEDDELLDFIIDLAVPWYVNFYVSWYRLCEQGAVNALWVTYEQLMSDKPGTVREILDFVGARNNSERTDEVLAGRYGSFRDGRTSQGETALCDTQKARIRRLFSYYSDVDFGRIGI